MKKNYLFVTVLMLAAMLLLAPEAFAQRTVNVAPGVGTLNTAVEGDTTATGARTDINTVYVLQRGGLYLTTGTISNSGYTLHIEAAAGSGARPIIQPAVVAGGTSSRPFDPKGNITLKGLYVTAQDELGANIDRVFRVRADSVRLIIDDCHIDYASQAAFRLDNKWNKLYITNSIISNMGSMQSPDNGRGVDDRGNQIDTLVYENCTFYNLTSRIIRDGGGIINYVKVDHNTIVNVGQRGCTFGEVIEGYYTNNLVINNGFLGRESTDTRSILEISPLGADLVAQGVQQKLVVDNNNFWNDPDLLAALPSGIVPVTVFDSTTAALITAAGTNQKQLNEAISFKTPMSKQKNVSVIAASWDAAVTTKVEMDDGTTNGIASGVVPFDFSYATTTQSYTYATSGKPLGDMTWFGITVDVEDDAAGQLPTDFALAQNYPNPFNPTTTISYNLVKPASVKLTVYNSLGQKVRTLVSTEQGAGKYSVQWNGTNESGSRVSSGIYFYRLNADGFVNVKKMILLK